MSSSLDSARYIATVLNDLHSVWTPHAGQIEVGRALFYDNKTRVFVRCGRKWGKQISLNEVILTPSGFTRYGDLKEGDLVFDERGKVQTVIGLSDINYSPEAYKITFCNGESIVACAEHRWLTYTKLNRRSEARYPGSQTPTIKTTREIKETLMHGKEYNHSIPYCSPIEMEEKDLLIEPYLLGCWLGDGSSHKAGITSADKEIIDSFSKYGTSYYSKYDYGVLGGFITKLKSLNLIGNKHIPSEYLLSSKNQRLELLQGLLDTDGTINSSGNQVRFDNTNKQLIDSVYFLVASLGMKPIIHERVGRLNRQDKKICYSVQFFPTLPVFKLPRKLSKIKASKKSLHHTIVSVERVESVPMKCIAVSGESKLYLIGKSLIPTHNTEFSCYTLYRWALQQEGAYYYIAPFTNQGVEIIWAPGRLQNFLRQLGPRYIDRVYEQEKRVVLKNGSFIKLTGSDNFEAGRGYNPHGAVYDEFKDHDIRFHQGFKDNLLTFKAPLVVVGTPPQTEEHHYCKLEEEYRHDPRGAVFKQTSYTNPHIDHNELDLERAAAIRSGELPKFMREIMVEIVPDGNTIIFPMLKAPKFNEATREFDSYTDHVRPADELEFEIKKYWRDWDFYCFFDPGSTSCFAALFVAINRYTKQLYCLDEIYKTEQMETSTRVVYPLAKLKMQELCPWEESWLQGYDYAAAWFATEVAVEYGEGLTPCQKDLKNKEAKLSFIKDLLLIDNCVKISSKCKKLVWEMRNYMKDENGRIPKVNDHLIDCFRYILNAAGYDTLPKDKRILPEDTRERRIEELIVHNEMTDEFLERVTDDYFD